MDAAEDMTEEEKRYEWADNLLRSWAEAHQPGNQPEAWNSLEPILRARRGDVWDVSMEMDDGEVFP